MGENRIVPGRVAQYFGDELVVGRLQTQLVREKLEEWQAAPTQKDDSPALGLTLLGLNAKQAVQHLRENDPKKVVEASDGIRLRPPVVGD